MRRQCKYCGEIYDDDLKFCIKCGNALTEPGNKNQSVKGKKGLKIVLIAAACVLAFAVGVIGVIVVLGNGDSGKDDGEAAAEAKAEVDENDRIEKKEASEDDYDKEGEPQTDEAGEYMIPYSNSRLLTASDLAGLTKEELRIARNEIFARHGRCFHDQELQHYFNSKSWYTGTVDADNFNIEVLNKFEKQNVVFIESWE